MKFLAWDIGIKNLAYSLIDFDVDKKTKEIIDWGIVNLMNDVDKGPKTEKLCCETNVNGNKCTSKATSLFSNDCTKGVCRKHQALIKYKMHKFLDITEKAVCQFEIIDKSTKEKHCCEKTALYAPKNDITKTYCSQHIKVLKKTEEFEVYEMKDDKKELVKGQSILTLSKRLYQHLDNLKDTLLNVDEIIIENQPVLKNPTMKTIQILLYGWFIMNGILTTKVKDIHFFSASKKLEAYDDKDDAIAKTVSHLSGQYQINKKLAILYTTEMLKKDTKWFNFFFSHQKKDDLSDAYLTNCYYIDREFKINKFAPKKKTTKKDDVEDETKKPKVFTDNIIIDSDDEESIDNMFKEMKKNKGKEEEMKENENEEEKEVEKKENDDNKKSYYFHNGKKYYRNNTNANTNINKYKKENNSIDEPVSLADFAKSIPKKKVIGIDNFLEK
jgi:hypothetical protein